MSRNKDEERRASFSATQRRACIVLILCLVGLIASIVAAWKIVGLSGSSTGYDATLYPVDTTLGAVLTTTEDAGNTYVSESLFVGDQQTVALSSLGQITLDQYIGTDGLAVADIISKACVYFEGDSAAYTIPQAIAKMKPRRLVITVGTNDAVAGKTVDAFIQDYKQAVKGMATTYPYCDILVNAVPPLPKGYANAAAAQLLIDQYNQALAVMCNDAGYHFLNSTESMRAATGYGEDSYFDATSGVWNKQGAGVFLTYLRSHAYQSEDQRPDTKDIPKRAAQAASSGATTATPTPTANLLTANYAVEAGKGTLTGNSQTGVASIEAKVAPRTTVSVTAVAADGYAFYKWSDGQTSETRYDIVTQDISVTAMFNDARVSISLDKGDSSLNVGEAITINAAVKLGDKEYDNSNVQWAVNDEMEANGGSYTFTATAGGSYVIKAGLEINGNYQSAAITVTVNAPATAISVTYASQMQAGATTTLTANIVNAVGDTQWSCDEIADWRPTGTTTTFTAPTVYDLTSTYHLHVTNNGVTMDFAIVATGITTAAPTPAPHPPAAPPADPSAPTVG
ncbi:MAG: SGNH/GDSL hydrolase family protein [Gemmiger sp.]|nr:SGNH/GDSL hydrolase family protein [Gemmiger sp.]